MMRLLALALIATVTAKHVGEAPRNNVERARQAKNNLVTSVATCVLMVGMKQTAVAADAPRTAKRALTALHAQSAKMARSWITRSVTMFVQIR